MSKVKIPPKPELFEWYKNEEDVRGTKFVSYEIYVIQRNTVLWGFVIGEDGDVSTTNTNLRYWNDYTEKDWEEILGDNYITRKVNYTPNISHDGLKFMIKVLLNEHSESKWYYGG